jgi:hypothetical protein
MSRLTTAAASNSRRICQSRLLHTYAVTALELGLAQHSVVRCTWSPCLLQASISVVNRRPAELLVANARRNVDKHLCVLAFRFEFGFKPI